MRSKLYYLFVNKIPGITYRYHKVHDNAVGLGKIFSYFYLLWLNLCYHCFFCRFLGKRPDVEFYEVKRLEIRESESREYKEQNPELTADAFVSKLSKCDVVSFDVFDTLIFRPFGLPTDVFYLIGEQMGIMDFRNIRAWAEWDARVKCNERYGHMEIGLKDIWENLAKYQGCNAEQGMQIEIDTELQLCYANPFMLEVWKRLIEMKKRIIIVSDMYLPAECITTMIEKAGFVGAEKIYVSCEYKKNKASGSLFKLVKKELGNVSVIHVGDNPNSDGIMAKKAGWEICPYQNVNKNMIINRAFDMSFIVGSAYRALVCNHLYNGLADYDIEYEYGFIYGGLFVVGYCSFIHDYCQKYDINKILFLSRDGDTLKQVYDYLYPDESTSYVYWSRKAATKLMADYDKHDYFRRFIYHKVNQEYTIKDILCSMELEFLVPQLSDWKKIWKDYTETQEKYSKALALKQLEEDQKLSTEEKSRKLKEIEKKFSKEELAKLHAKNFFDLKENSELTDKNGYLLRRFIEAKWDQVIKHYANQQEAARTYYSEQLDGCDKAVAVDIGWAGSGALALSYLTEHVWEIPCEITGIIAGTNTPYNAEPDASEAFLQSGKLVAYLYSHSHNRDLLKKHDPNKDYNVFWELLLSSPTPKFNGFYMDKYGKVELKFGEYDKNLEGIRQIQQGILDFASQYMEHFKAYPYMFNISGRDAYAPMLLAASRKERYLKMIEKRFDLDINVN